MKPLFASLLALSLLTACADPMQRHKQIATAISQNLAQGIYATNDSIHAGRFDMAQKYSDQTTRLCPPPKARIPVQAITNP